MHISVTCPRCDSRYQVQPDLRGKLMRCPNPVCRAVFEVAANGEGGDSSSVAAGSPPAQPPAARSTALKEAAEQMSGNVGEIVPMLPAEAVPVSAPEADPLPETQEPVAVPVASVPAAEAEPAADMATEWPATPPPIQMPTQPGEMSARRVSAADEELSDADFLGIEEGDRGEANPAEPLEQNQQSWRAPPVRLNRLPHAAESSVGPSEQLQTPQTRAISKRRRRAGWILLGLLLFLCGGIGSAFYLFRSTLEETEALRFKKAEQLYEDQRFGEAALLLQALNRDFPDSKERIRHLFLQELAAVREAVYFPQGGPEGASRQVFEFLAIHRGDPLLKNYAGDVWLTLQKLAREEAEQAAQKFDARLAARARMALAEAAKLAPPPRVDADRQTQEIESALVDLENQIAVTRQRDSLFKQLEEIAHKPSAQAVEKAQHFVRRSGFASDSAFQKTLHLLMKKHLESVAYVPASEKPESSNVATPANGPDREPSLAVVSLLRRESAVPANLKDTVFALARGVLYACEPATGKLRWARRLGVDTTHLPLRIPPTDFAPAVAVVTASDYKTISALDEETGATVWEHVLAEPCLAQPVLIGPSDGEGRKSGPLSSANRLLVPTYSGRVDELQVSDGRLLGSYLLGQKLPITGVHQRGTPFVYFAGDSFCTYVLDVSRQACAAVLYTQHARGSVHTPPLIIADPAAGGEGQGVLVFPQEEQGSDTLVLRCFTLPVADPQQTPLGPAPKVKGRLWFPPYQDGQRLALATDAGLCSVFGIRSREERGPLLFRQPDYEVPLGSGGVTLGPETKSKADAKNQRHGYLSDIGTTSRALIVDGNAENFWVLAGGRLQRLQCTFSTETGPKIVHRWPESPLLGSPVQPAQVLGDEHGDRVLFLATELGSGCVLTAVNAETGQVYWQRQLGLVPDEPGQAVISVGKHILVKDHDRILHFHARPENRKPWESAGDVVAVLDRPGQVFILPDGPDSAHILNSAGTSLCSMRWHTSQHTPGSWKSHSLPSPLSGTPCLGKECLILPLANRILARLDFDSDAPASGPNWRDPDTAEGAIGHAVSVGRDEYVCTDGNDGLKLIHWAEPKLVETKSRLVRLPRRITAAPVVIPPERDGSPPRLCVADAGDALTLLDAWSLTALRTWHLPGKITTGPFVRGQALACIVDKNLLVWIDPDKEQPLWEYAFTTDIVGAPLLLNDMVIVADLAGHIDALDPAKGQPLAKGYTLSANVAPATGPLPFTEDRVFLPLTDGTVMLLSRGVLR